MARSPARLSGLMNHPYFWLWMGAGMFVLSLAMLWKPKLDSTRMAPTPEKISQVAPSVELPILSADRVPKQPTLYPFRISHKSGRSRERVGQVTPASHVAQSINNSSAQQASPQVTHANWETDSANRPDRIQQVSVSYVEAETPSAAWLTGTIEAVNDTQKDMEPVPQAAAPITTAPMIEQTRTSVKNSVISPADDDALPVVIPSQSRTHN